MQTYKLINNFGLEATLEISEKRQEAYWINKVIATNNPNIDIPKVIDEVDNIIKNAFYDKKGDFKRSTIGADDWINGLKLGYNKAKETYKFTEEDMIEFAQYVLDNISYNNDKLEEMLFTWKKQQLKTIYYEK